MFYVRSNKEETGRIANMNTTQGTSQTTTQNGQEVARKWQKKQIIRRVGPDKGCHWEIINE